jgi:catechol 2,3-dioxygenase-like lactoylglutathione lyase family enzyme
VPTRLVHLVVDANDPPALGRFWAAVLGWEVLDEEPSETDIGPAGYTYPDPVTQTLVFVPVSEPKKGKNRVHLDLATRSAEHQAAEVERILALGATRADVGQGDVPWEVLADPEGNEFCVATPLPEYLPASGLLAAISIDCADPVALAGFWELAAGWQRTDGDAEAVSLRAPEGVGPHLILVKVPDPNSVKNRVHLDVAPYKGEDLAEAVAALRAAGATPVDIGQGNVRWRVLADLEGGEFCVLTPR